MEHGTARVDLINAMRNEYSVIKRRRMSFIDLAFEDILEKYNLHTYELVHDKFPDMSLPYSEEKIGVAIIRTPAPEPDGLVSDLSLMHPAWKAKWEELK